MGPILSPDDRALLRDHGFVDGRGGLVLLGVGGGGGGDGGGSRGEGRGDRGRRRHLLIGLWEYLQINSSEWGLMEGRREGGRDGWREGGREGGMEGGRERGHCLNTHTHNTFSISAIIASATKFWYLMSTMVATVSLSGRMRVGPNTTPKLLAFIKFLSE